tara:strand:+ start:1105 stop:2259 length:1155 start_codon:yes stop_codon:yes gene_type:complete
MVNKKTYVAFPFVGTKMGGSYKSASLLSKYIDKEHFNSTVFIPSKGENFSLFKKIENVVDYNLPKFIYKSLRYENKNYVLKMISSVIVFFIGLKNLLKHKPDIVHANDVWTMLTWGAAAKILGIKVIWHVRQIQKSKLEKILIGLSDKIITISEKVHTRFESSDIEKNIILNGVEEPNLLMKSNISKANFIYKNYSVSDSDFIVGFVGSIKESKGTLVLIKSAIRLFKKGLEFKLVVIGAVHNREYFNSILELINQPQYSKYKENFIFTGFIAKASEAIKFFDIMVVPSKEEPFGLIIIESFFSKTVVIGSDQGGIPEIITDKQNGILFNSEDDMDLSIKISSLIKNKDERDRLSINAYKTANEKFTIRCVVKKVEEEYLKLVK